MNICIKYSLFYSPFILNGGDQNWSLAPFEIVFQEQSYSSLHSGRSLEWDHFYDIIINPSVNWQSRGANVAIGDSSGAGLEKVPISPWLVTLLHLQSYTNTAIADITENSALISPKTQRERRYHHAERRCYRAERRYRRIECWVFEYFMFY